MVHGENVCLFQIIDYNKKYWILTLSSMHTTHSLVLGVSSGLGTVGVRGVLGVRGGVNCCCRGTVGMNGPGSCSSLNLGEFFGEFLGESVLWEN